MLYTSSELDATQKSFMSEWACFHQLRYGGMIDNEDGPQSALSCKRGRDRDGERVRLDMPVVLTCAIAAARRYNEILGLAKLKSRNSRLSECQNGSYERGLKQTLVAMGPRNQCPLSANFTPDAMFSAPIFLT